MAITRSQQREIDRRQQEECARREQEEAEKRHALKMAVKASLESMPESLKLLERDMSNLNTNDDISVATTTTTTMHSIIANREHTNPLDQPLNTAPVSKADTQRPLEFSAAQKAAYKAQRQDCMFAAVSDPETSANSATYISNSSGGGSSTAIHVPKERLSSVSLESDMDSLEYRATSTTVVAVQITEERRESVSTQSHTDSTSAYDEFSINTEQPAASPPL
ncbi:hypothetical protein MBANPS3_008259 [Mucor bainieri]